MRVKDLIKALQQFPPEALVVTEGYETGYEPIKKVLTIRVTETPNKEWWDGYFTDSKVASAIEVVFLDAETRKEVE
jgi:hypothetical protein